MAEERLIVGGGNTINQAGIVAAAAGPAASARAANRDLVIDQKEEKKPLIANPNAFDRYDTAIQYLKIVIPMASTCFVNAVPAFLMTKWLSPFKDGLAGSAYVANVQTLLLEPVTNLMTQASNEIGDNYGKTLSEDVKITPEMKLAAEKEIGDVFRQTSVMALIVTIPSIGIALLAKPALIHLFHQPVGPVEVANDVFIPLAIGMLPQQVLRGQFQLLGGLTKVKETIAILTGYGAVISGLGYLLINKSGLGPAGYGWSFCATSYLSCLGLMAYLRFGSGFERYDLFKWDFSRTDILRKLFRLGTPTGLRVLAEELGLSAVALLAGLQGSNSVSKVQTVNQYIYLITSFVIFSSSIHSAMVSQAKGANNYHLARFYGKTGYGLGLATTSLVLPLMILLSKQLSEVFSDDESIVSATQQLFLIQGINLMVDSIRNFSAASLRGFEDNSEVLLYNALGLLIGVAGGYLLSGAEILGLDGVLVGRGLGILTTTALSAYRWFWRSNLAVETGTSELPQEPPRESCWSRLCFWRTPDAPQPVANPNGESPHYVVIEEVDDAAPDAAAGAAAAAVNK